LGVVGLVRVRPTQQWQDEHGGAGEALQDCQGSHEISLLPKVIIAQSSNVIPRAC
jgi:hypothetical protein